MAYHHTLLQTLFLVIIATGVKLSECSNITIVNYCKETIWPAIIPNDNFTGFALKRGQSAIFNAPANWSGRIWARTGCNFEQRQRQLPNRQLR
ncbi:hypothetical protein F0562_020319 [Nyssa sinensis]|uniref:Uncharacterized protein n=1 Tax=Nyssa sinensis TaxID=561372 RepID=A0A5J5BRC6_9ASTE|nr:hypothetical protein F0562_020319 [Nyssa sinensis]